ncbi:hypothetical protein OGAPHI_006916 [Ogataea philodendri]|uniref:Uncharacterized protein n=1 Tax=Ogataea philodendri TaxID=1378263 RepID=A0A9P8NV88_9ASCO|nr:uncharacterized protein OGAPHI_006916 [Ogataea philodendri]KAH3660330.1 hypothetical protein OGAPHI_006916 [Ogataea philodendri]
MLEPTLTELEPCLRASSKSLLMPMLSLSLVPSSASSFCDTCTSVLKSWFSSEEVDCAMDPIVIRPSRCSFGHSSTITFASCKTSSGETPDFWSSPEVLTWM